VERELQRLCGQLRPGDRIPTHLQLMRQFSASERTVLEVLGDLAQRGFIIRKHGSGTFVARGNGEVNAVVALFGSVTGIAGVTEPEFSLLHYFVQQFHESVHRFGMDLAIQPISPGQPFCIPTAAAVAVFGYELATEAAILQAAGKRVVIIGTPPEGESPPVPCITGSYYGAELIISHLYELGHRRVDFVHPDENLHLNRRWHAAQVASEATPLHDPLTVNLVPASATGGWHTSAARVREFFGREGAATALIAWNNDAALDLLAQMQWAGIRVPQQVSIVAYDGLPSSARSHPALTTMDPQLGEVTRLAVEMLLEEPFTQLPATTVVMPRLVVRESTAQVVTQG
jgi:hypothetical protein